MPIERITDQPKATDPGPLNPRHQVPQELILLLRPQHERPGQARVQGQGRAEVRLQEPCQFVTVTVTVTVAVVRVQHGRQGGGERGEEVAEEGVLGRGGVPLGVDVAGPVPLLVGDDAPAAAVERR